jgi:hypothetical protein
VTIASGDRLLRFISERGTGSSEELKRAWAWSTSQREAPSSVWIMMRDLRALGHVEMSWSDGLAWAAAPPVLTVLPRAGGTGFLTGARTGWLTESLEAACEETGCYSESVTMEGSKVSGIYLAFDNGLAARELADRLKIEFAESVAEALAAVLPTLATLLSHAKPAEMPLGFPAEMFNTMTMTWVPADTDHRCGLYRVRTHQRFEFRLRSANGELLNVQPEPGIFEALRYEEEMAIGYSVKSGQLEVDSTAWLPPMHARAATLCSGRLPRFVRRGSRQVLIYENVPPRVAAEIARSLSQPVDWDTTSDEDA